MRVIAGKFRSRQLKSLKGMALRPTSDRLRETLFNVLGERVAGSFFVDVFAGTGAVGIEALSRGAQNVVFVEKHAPAAALIKKNLESLEVTAGPRVLTVDAVHGLEILAKEKPAGESGPDIVFLDPPYGNMEDYDRVMSVLGFASLLGEGSLVVAEHRRNFELPEAVGGLQRVRVLRQGDAVLSFYRFTKQNRKNGPALAQT
ncbi:MAG TPA: 16S rRNA (guanine(966)-N(2))-methyltransferase RsmD [Candidatus Limnocylindrales bacterium]|nr:16S rRNA (guanine(966)-N(2))-methyltransferase RsmD [Candidatus Limnocylindrales bacterium]